MKLSFCTIRGGKGGGNNVKRMEWFLLPPVHCNLYPAYSSRQQNPCSTKARRRGNCLNVRLFTLETTRAVEVQLKVAWSQKGSKQFPSDIQDKGS